LPIPQVDIPLLSWPKYRSYIVIFSLCCFLRADRHYKKNFSPSVLLKELFIIFLPFNHKDLHGALIHDKYLLYKDTKLPQFTNWVFLWPLYIILVFIVKSDITGSIVLNDTNAFMYILLQHNCMFIFKTVYIFIMIIIMGICIAYSSEILLKVLYRE